MKKRAQHYVSILQRTIEKAARTQAERLRRSGRFLPPWLLRPRDERKA